MKKMHRWAWLFPVLGLGLLINGCHKASTPLSPPSNVTSSTPTVTSSATRTYSPSFTATRTRTVSATATPTLSATRTFSATTTATSTVTPTQTHTPTITFTATPTRTTGYPTETFTFSPTSTATFTVTDTPTVTRTFTATSTFTETRTPTITHSPTETVTPSATNALCSAASLQTTYTFETSLDCWHPDNMTAIPGWSLTTAAFHGGAQSFGVTVSSSTTSTITLQFEVGFNPAANMGAKGVSLWVMVDGNLAGNGQAQIFTQSGAVSVWNSGGYRSLPTAGTWYLMSWIPPFSGAGEDSAQVHQFGLQLYNVVGPVNGHVYIDDVSLYTVSTPTPTRTPLTTLQGWYFDVTPNTYTNNNIGTAAGQAGTWFDSGNGNVTGAIDWEAPGYGASAGCLNSLMTFTGLSQNENITLTPSTVPWNLQAMNVTGIRARVWVDSNLSSGSIHEQIFFASGSGSTWEWSNWLSLTKGAWTAVNFDPPFSAVGTDKSQVQRIWFQTGTNTSGTYTFGTGYVKLDNIELY